MLSSDLLSIPFRVILRILRTCCLGHLMYGYSCNDPSSEVITHMYGCTCSNGKSSTILAE